MTSMLLSGPHKPRRTLMKLSLFVPLGFSFSANESVVLLGEYCPGNVPSANRNRQKLYF